VTEDGETGHPMDVCAATVAVDAQDAPDDTDMARLAELIERDVRRRSALRRARTARREHVAKDTNR
jgi:hypothetical protein